MRVTSAQYVHDFDEPTTGGRGWLGGRGIGLAEMRQLAVPVPAEFTITTDACRAYPVEGDLPAGRSGRLYPIVIRTLVPSVEVVRHTTGRLRGMSVEATVWRAARHQL
jgi:phosphoenolpyruvate synthase/pyruvate phosphate dikinase